MVQMQILKMSLNAPTNMMLDVWQVFINTIIQNWVARRDSIVLINVTELYLAQKEPTVLHPY